MSVVNVEICCRIPSFFASLVVRSARTASAAAEARLIDGRQPRHGVGDPLAVDGKAWPGGADPHALAADDEPGALTARWRHCARSGSTAFAQPVAGRTRCGSSATPTRKRRASRVAPAGASRLLALERQRDRLVESSSGVGGRALGRGGRQCRARRERAGETVTAAARAAGRSSAGARGPRRRRRSADRGRDDTDEPLRDDDLGADGASVERARDCLARSAPRRAATSTGSTASTGGLGSTSCRTRWRNESWPVCTSAACVARSSTISASLGLTSYVLSATTTCTLRSRSTSVSATPGSGFSQ